MIRLFNTVAFRLAMGYGILVLCAVAVIGTTLYLGTVGVLDREIDGKLYGNSDRLIERFGEHWPEGIQKEINQLLTDRVDFDTEVYLLVEPDGKKIIGNIDPVTGTALRLDRPVDTEVVRYGRLSTSRLLPRELSNGAILIVGRDLRDIHEINQLVLRSLVLG